MSISKENAIKLAEKILKDIDFWGNDLTNSRARLIFGENLKFGERKNNYWLTAFNYGAEDFGEGGASVFIEIDEVTGIPDRTISTRSGSIRIKYDKKTDTYSRI